MVMEGGNNIHGTSPQATTLADGPDASRVAREFVRQYYTILHESPLHLHRFYNEESEFLHGSIDTVAMTVRGQQEIHKAIVGLDFQNCYAKIHYVDAQESENKMVVVQVAGQLTNKGGPTRHFMQTFVLVPLTARKYYVRNDIFRYQDQVFQEDEEVDEVTKVDNTQEGQQITHETPIFNGGTGEHATLNGNELSQTPEKDSNQWDNSMAQTTPVQSTVQAAQQQQSSPSVAQTATQESQSSPANNAPRSWSQMVQVKKVTAEVAPAAAPVSTFGPPATTFGGNATSQALPQRSQNRGTPRSNGTNGPSTKRESTASREDDANNIKSFTPDNQQLFVGNIPTNVSDKALTDLFSRFGKVSEFRLSTPKSGPGNKGSVPNYGFVIFESPDAVQKVLAEVKNGSGQWEIEEGKPLRLNIEEKKSRNAGGQKGPRGPNNGPRGDRRPIANGGRRGDFNNGRVPRTGPSRGVHAGGQQTPQQPIQQH